MMGKDHEALQKTVKVGVLQATRQRGQWESGNGASDTDRETTIKELVTQTKSAALAMAWA